MLKELLRKNKEKLGGKKNELAERIAMCKVFGLSPFCPNCEKGKLKLDIGWYLKMFRILE